MKNLIKKAALVLGIGVVVVSCGKYEDGPGISLRSKKARLAGEWKVSKYSYDGVDGTSFFADYTYTVDKEGTWTATFGSLTSKGTWELVDSKENLKTVTDGSSDTDGDTVVITMLKNKEMHVKSKDGKEIIEYTAK